MLVDDFKENRRGGGGGERAELPGRGAAHAKLHVTHSGVFAVCRNARTNGTAEREKCQIKIQRIAFA